jgi:hypothetical protein
LTVVDGVCGDILGRLRNLPQSLAQTVVEPTREAFLMIGTVCGSPTRRRWDRG